MNEANIKLLIVKEAKALGYYARRLEHQYLTGMPDMFIKAPNTDWLWIEVKYMPRETTSATYPNRMSLPQRRQLEKMTAVNGKVYVLTVSKKHNMYLLRFSTDFNNDPLAKADATTFKKEFGKKWPVEAFMLALG